MRVEKLRDLVARLHARPRRRLTLLVGVDGPTGSGKTAFTRALVALDPGLDVVPTGDFLLPAADRRDGPDEDLVAPDLDWRRLRSSVLLPLSRDQPARYQRYDRAAGSLAEWRMVPVGGIVIVEGLYACSRPLSTFYDFRVWIDGGRPPQSPAEDAYAAAQGPAAAAHLRVDGSGLVPHDRALEYVRI